LLLPWTQIQPSRRLQTHDSGESESRSAS
jgi:hypothetical protein